MHTRVRKHSHKHVCMCEQLRVLQYFGTGRSKSQKRNRNSEIRKVQTIAQCGFSINTQKIMFFVFSLNNKYCKSKYIYYRHAGILVLFLFSSFSFIHWCSHTNDTIKTTIDECDLNHSLKRPLGVAQRCKQHKKSLLCDYCYTIS